MEWSDLVDEEANKATSLLEGVCNLSSEMGVTAFHGCELSRYHGYIEECRMRRHLSTRPSDHSIGRGIYFSNSPLHALMWSIFRCCAQKSLATPLNQLQGIVIEAQVRLHSWTYVGRQVVDRFINSNRYKRHRGDKMDTDEVVISGFSNAYTAELECPETELFRDGARQEILECSVAGKVIKPTDLLQLSFYG